MNNEHPLRVVIRPTSMREPGWPEYMALWDAINGYAQACKGDTGLATIGDARMDAVVGVECALEKLLKVVSCREEG